MYFDVSLSHRDIISSIDLFLSLDCAGLAGAEEVDAVIAGAAGLLIVVVAGLEVAGLLSNMDGFVEAKVVARGESADAGVGAGKSFGVKAVGAGDRVTGKRLAVAAADVVEVVGLSVPVAGGPPKRPEATVAVDGVVGALLPPYNGAGAVVEVGVDVAAGGPPKKDFGAAAVAAPPKSDEGGTGAAVGAADEGAVRKFHQWGL